ncbi:hypothetical protein H8S95_17520 [Pontibacter sp. KCTC 32443]|uniref:hypothetical protein n=1 Tax=Pontibacter TaxID=323449 RepID=UPI00164E9BC8|nr:MULTISPECIES: hypothetical protein [Pontibacter]MBC5775879.1 hypothetical protein [Pontibacter sp. KCTC 32443]
MNNNKNQMKGKADAQNPKSKVKTDPTHKVQQTEDSKVQNPNRNLAQGGNNMPYKKK